MMTMYNDLKGHENVNGHLTTWNFIEWGLFMEHWGKTFPLLPEIGCSQQSPLGPKAQVQIAKAQSFAEILASEKASKKSKPQREPCSFPR